MNGLVVSLDQLPRGATAVVRQLRGGDELAHRLAALGLTVGAPFVVLQNTRRGPLLVNVRDTRIALGRGEAAKILVERTAP
ncbi:MAG: ferrous iron transport protein A [Rubrivivax sp.]|nr:ferrous iron transport protein A [Rubrivivax sp.]